MMTTIFKEATYLDCGFVLQMPYLNANGHPICIDIDPHAARRLVVDTTTHRLIFCYKHPHTGQSTYIVTPQVRAVVDFEF